MARRFTSLLIVAMVPAVMLLASACTSNDGSVQGKPAASSASHSATASSAALTPQQVLPLLFQCLTGHNITIWDRAQGNTNLASVGERQGWYKNGRVLANQALYTDADALEGFYPISPDFKPQQTIGDWVTNVALTRTWPKICGPVPSGR